MNDIDIDKNYIARCLLLASKGRFSADPNPMVGAIIVKNNKIVGKGYHKRPGSPHAEQMAIKQAGKQAVKSTLYINLEPCCHHGKTPPCSDLIIKNKISRVVISSIDPNPLVNTRSIKQLRKAGIQVNVGILKDEALNLNKGFFTRFTKKRPYITAKFGMSLDGKISLANGVSKWITSKESRRDVHLERAMTSIILTSSKTIISDNSRFTIRDKDIISRIDKQPDLAILDSSLEIPLNHKVFIPTNRMIYLFTLKENIRKKYKKNVKVIKVSKKDNQISLSACIKYLGKNNFNNVFVEAGSSITSTMLKLNLIDELLLYISPKIIGESGKSFSGVSYINKLSRKIKYRINDIIRLEKDIKVRLIK